MDKNWGIDIQGNNKLLLNIKKTINSIFNIPIDNDLFNKKEFKAFYYEKSKKIMQVGLILTVFIYSIHIIIDLYMLSESKKIFILYRTIIFPPFYIIFFFFTFTKLFDKYNQFFLFLNITIIANIAVLSVMFTAKVHELAYNYYIFSALLMIMFTFILTRLMFYYALLANIIFILCFEILMIFIRKPFDSKEEFSIFLLINFLLFSVFLLSMFSCLYLNNYMKKEFINQKKLKELDKSKTNFFGNISHELRTPLTIIKGYTKSIISGDYGKTIKSDENMFNVIFKNSVRLVNLINNILDFNKIESGKMNLTKENTDIKKLLKYYVAMFESVAENNGLSLIYDDETDFLIANIDRKKFETIIFNLFSNACKFTEKGGEMSVELYKDSKNFYIKISDTGIGIPENKLESIFERFSQADENTTRKYEGSGIGLSLTKELIELHGGRIEVHSKLGKGSTFIVNLPYEKSLNTDNTTEIIDIDKDYFIDLIKENRDESIKIVSDEKKEKNILLLEDNLDLHDYVISFLSKDYNIYTAKNGIEGLEKLKEIKHLDLIIADIMMPKMDGREFQSHLQKIENCKNIPFIYLTARATHEEKIDDINKGAIDYILKPFDKNELIAKINSILSNFEKQKNEIISNIIDSAINIKKNNKNNSYCINDLSIKYNITSREKEIIELLLDGLQTKEISGKLKIKENTVSNHIQNIYSKLGISNRVELVNLVRK